MNAPRILLCLTLAATIGLMVAGCGESPDDDTNTQSEAISKEEAARRAGKGDQTDFCALFGWYGDGICDPFCPEPDPDCGSNFCGGIAGIPCDAREYCDYGSEMCGIADGGGVCRARPEVCTREYRPVCGCDGNTYSNACGAAAAGASVLHDGACDDGPDCPLTGVVCTPECPDIGEINGAPCERGNFNGDTCTCDPVDDGGGDCGGFAGFVCGDGEYCDYSNGCGFADQLGECKPRPEVCTANYAPVCGCDGSTYSNSCAAAAAGVDVSHDGECQVDCAATGVLCTPECPDTGEINGAPCQRGNVNSDTCVCEPIQDACGGLLGLVCDAGEFCNYGPDCGFADQTGTCQPRPEACITLYDPVCGCDGNTYSNGCFANSAGVAVASEGPCN